MARSVAFGRPGSHPAMLARAELRRMCGPAVALVASGVVTLVAFRWALSSGSWFVPAAAGAVAAGCYYQVSSVFSKWKRASVGARSERIVGRLAEGAGAAVVVHGAMLGAGGDADHVVLGPCVAVVEAKRGVGPLKVSGGKVMVGSRVLRGDPIEQASRQARALSNRVGVTASAVVCVEGATGSTVRVGEVFVCPASSLREVLRGLPRLMSAERARKVGETLAPQTER